LELVVTVKGYKYNSIILKF